MKVYECNACGASELFDRFTPDCCAVCGSSVSLLSDDGWEGVTDQDLNFMHAETAYDEESVDGVIGRRGRALPAAIGLVVSSMVLLSLFGNAGAMADCQVDHSFNTCFETLHR